MPKISQVKKDKISEQILHHLFSISPELKFTSDIAREIARDEEFTKVLLQALKSKNLVNEINKNPSGVQYLKRQRWRLSNQAFDIYKKHQNNQNNQNQPSSQSNPQLNNNNVYIDEDLD